MIAQLTPALTCSPAPPCGPHQLLKESVSVVHLSLAEGSDHRFFRDLKQSAELAGIRWRFFHVSMRRASYVYNLPNQRWLCQTSSPTQAEPAPPPERESRKENET